MYVITFYITDKKKTEKGELLRGKNTISTLDLLLLDNFYYSIDNI